MQDKLLDKLVCRGPDITKDVTVFLETGKELYLLGTLLQMRGQMTPQPHPSCPPNKPSGDQNSGTECKLVYLICMHSSFSEKEEKLLLPI